MPSRRRRLAALAAVAVALAAWCGWVSGFHRRTLPALVTWLASLAAVVAVNLLLWQGRRRRRPGWRLEPAGVRWPGPASRGRHHAFLGALPWLSLLLVGVVWDVLGLDTPPNRSHLTISALTQAYRPLNAAILLVWLLAGVGYGVARARAPVPARAPPPVTPCVVPALLLPSNPPLGVGFWLGLVAAGLALDLAARWTNGRVATAGQLLRFVTRSPAANAILVLAWGYAGYHLFAY